ncbi:hypothetical protein [Geminicoccus harenae]|uniref:hypothetical protein n=1 Tax=Geminicoccus harenae TaxID=2498453 RepID=UPI00168B0315|nr:hypothetical protein [Geminicoccus harenae]
MKTHITAPAGEIGWNYSIPPDRGAKVLLLTVGHIAVLGRWEGRVGEFYLAWSPLPKRDKVRERMIETELAAERVVGRVVPGAA